MHRARYTAYMITRHTRGKVTWIDLETPNYEELSSVLEEFGIDPRIEDEIVAPTPYPLTLAGPSYLYLILHFPTADPAGGTKSQEVDFIVGKKFIITARYETIDSLHTLHKVFEAEELMGTAREATAASLLEQILRRLYGALRDELEQVATTLERIERDIFAGKERTTVRAISNTSRVLLRFETALARHTEPLDTFLDILATPAFFGKPFAVHATQIEAEHDHVAALVESYRAVTRELRITNDSLLSSSQNEIMKTLTVLAFTAVPLTLVASLFGMNIEAMPIVHSPHAFWMVLGIMAIVGLSFFLFFRIKRWL